MFIMFNRHETPEYCFFIQYLFVPSSSTDGDPVESILLGGMMKRPLPGVKHLAQCGFCQCWLVVLFTNMQHDDVLEPVEVDRLKQAGRLLIGEMAEWTTDSCL